MPRKDWHMRPLLENEHRLSSRLVSAKSRPQSNQQRRVIDVEEMFYLLNPKFECNPGLGICSV